MCYRKKKTPLAFFKSILEHVIKKKENMIVDQLCYDTQERIDYTFEFASDRLKNLSFLNFMIRVALFVHQFMMVTTKNILIFLNTKKKCAEFFSQISALQEMKKPYDQSNLTLMTGLRNHPNNRPISSWEDIEIYQDPEILEH
jgi:hypothetical protein